MDEQLSRYAPIPFVKGGVERLEKYFNMSSDNRELSDQVMHDIVEAARLYVSNCVSIKKILGG